MFFVPFSTLGLWLALWLLSGAEDPNAGRMHLVDAVFSLTLKCFAKVICVLKIQLIISGLGLLTSSLGFLPLFSLLEQFSVYLYFKLCSSFCDRLRFSHLCFHFLLVFENLGILIHKSCFPWASSKLFLSSLSGFSWVLILFPFHYEVNNEIVHPFVCCFALLLHN